MEENLYKGFYILCYMDRGALVYFIILGIIVSITNFYYFIIMSNLFIDFHGILRTYSMYFIQDNKVISISMASTIMSNDVIS